MKRVTFLGTGFSQPTADRHAISLHIDGSASVLIDAGGDPAKGLARAHLLSDLDAVVLTHHHTDHVGGLPSLVHASRFVGRDTALVVAAAPDVLERVKRACDALDAQAPYGIEWVELDPQGERLELAGTRIETTPAEHTVPALAVRFDDVTYSSDTRPCEAVAELARDCDLLIHEATHGDPEFMARVKHSTPAEAGDVARRAGAAALALVHMHPSLEPSAALEACAFEPAWVPRDGDALEFWGDGWEFQAAPARITPHS